MTDIGYREVGRQPEVEQRLDITEQVYERVLVPVLQLAVVVGASFVVWTGLKLIATRHFMGGWFAVMMGLFVAYFVLRRFYLPQLTRTLLFRDDAKNLLRLERRVLGRLIDSVEIPFTSIDRLKLSTQALDKTGNVISDLIPEGELKKRSKRWDITITTDDRTLTLSSYRTRARSDHHVERIALFLGVLSAQISKHPLISRMHPPIDHNPK